MAKAELQMIQNFKDKNEHHPTRAYLCEYCDRWHLTSKTLEQYKMNSGKFDLDTYLDVPFDRYLSDREHVSNSTLKKIGRSPAHMFEYLNNPDNAKPSKALITGRAAHAMVLEPDYFNREYFVIPNELKALTKQQLASIEKGKPTPLAAELQYKWQVINDEANGRELIKESDLEHVQGMRAALMVNPKIQALLGVGKAEQSRFWVDAESGVKCRMRADWVHGVSENVIVDYKTCEDARPEAFARSVITYGYDIQAAHYKQGGKAEYFYIIAQEKAAPFASMVYLISSDWILRGENLRRNYLTKYAECLESDSYPAYPMDTSNLEIPKWA